MESRLHISNESHHCCVIEVYYTMVTFSPNSIVVFPLSLRLDTKQKIQTFHLLIKVTVISVENVRVSQSTK